MNWDNATVLKFIKLYKLHSCIWDPKNKYHKNRQSVHEAWNNIRQCLGLEYSVKDLKKKKESLMAAYRGYKIKIRRSERSGALVYQPSWFAFPLMDSFLGSIYSCNSSINNESEEIDEKDISNVNATTETTEFLQPDENTETYLYTSSPHQYHSSFAEHLTPTASMAFKRKHNSPPELIHAQKQMKQAFNFMKSVYQRSKDDDDECSIFGVLIAKKLRKLSEERRDIMMIKINQLFIDERRDNISNLTSNKILYSPSSSVYEVEVIHNETNSQHEYILPNAGMDSTNESKTTHEEAVSH